MKAIQCKNVPGNSCSELPVGPKINLGCGPVQPDGWVNVDGSNRVWLAAKLPLLDWALTKMRLLPPTEFGRRTTIHNLFKPLPFRDNTVACIYAGEVWEHFEYADAARLTADCYRALAPGGVLRVCVPDGVSFWERYLKLYHEIRSRPKKERSAQPLHDHVAMHFRDICTRRVFLGSMGHKHKWQFDEVQLVELFESVGLTNVQRMPYHHSCIPDVARVEQSPYLIVEGVKPGNDPLPRTVDHNNS